MLNFSYQEFRFHIVRLIYSLEPAFLRYWFLDGPLLPWWGLPEAARLSRSQGELLLANSPSSWKRFSFISIPSIFLFPASHAYGLSSFHFSLRLPRLFSRRPLLMLSFPQPLFTIALKKSIDGLRREEMMIAYLFTASLACRHFTGELSGFYRLTAGSISTPMYMLSLPLPSLFSWDWAVVASLRTIFQGQHARQWPHKNDICLLPCRLPCWW